MQHKRNKGSDCQQSSKTFANSKLSHRNDGPVFISGSKQWGLDVFQIIYTLKMHQLEEKNAKNEEKTDPF